ncbi:shikimate kinase [Geomesophilobacter sediminis]|uniref:Shikimate kinase n=1 Tax=Geomesophilobacter sediminis TaxID=2798584 RepID=A0A8J7J1A1_9BACT|nr:shikimate kinase [Geomesophilobacter sediminis]MBJ6724423.1 shikimate kinase [Geomesophilobacter sediminis]
MAAPRSNIVLIGMPGSGKSTVGPKLAEQLSLKYLDTDLLITVQEGRELQSIVDADGYLELRRLEERTLLELDCEHHVIATGGSAVYSDAGMTHLRQRAAVVFLDVDLETLTRRIDDEEHRGLVRRPGQTIAELYAERLPLYRRYADLRVVCTGLGADEVCTLIRAGLARDGSRAEL